MSMRNYPLTENAALYIDGVMAAYINLAMAKKNGDVPAEIAEIIKEGKFCALAKEYNADGIIYEQVKFCDPWAYERMVGSRVLHDDYGYQVLSIDRPYNVSGVGQLRTRVQAFVESLEIKKIQGGSK